MGKRVLINSENFYPIRGGGEKYLENLILKLIQDDYEIEVITVIPEVEGFDKKFEYSITRIIEDKITSKQILGLSVSEFVWGSGKYAEKYFNRKYNKMNTWTQIENQIIEKINSMKPFDVYIGVGQFGAKIKPYSQDIVSIIKKQNSDCKTFYLEFDMYHFSNPNGEKKDLLEIPNIDYIISLNEHDLNHKSILNENNKICLPPILEIDNKKYPKDWEDRPYDFGFISPLYHKGNSIVRNLLLDYPEKKFLIKKPSYGSEYDLNEIYPLISKNYDVLDWVDDIDKDFYQKCKFILYPSLNEGYGMVPVEAILNGAIPIVNKTDSNYWVHENNVYYVDTEMQKNSILYNFQYYLDNYSLINSQWTSAITHILNYEKRIYPLFIGNTNVKVKKHHRQRFEKLYLEFKKILEE